jgi:predicted transposase YbfD/YdcC
MAHEEVECKTNEIPVAQKLIPELGIKDAVFTSDAINCQLKTIDTVKASDNNIIVQVKSNQKNLLQECKRIAKSNVPIFEHQEQLSKERNRIEKRNAKVFSPDILQLGKWNKVSCIIEIERNREVLNTKNNKWENKGEISYYIATKTLSAEKANAMIRNHWGIENKNHYVKDATMNEDKSRIRVNPQNMARFRSFALNIMRFNNVKNIKQELYRNALDFANLQNYNGLYEN